MKERVAQRGSSLVEFALTALLLLTVIFAVFEFSRLLLAYGSLANATRMGVRFAIVRGDESGAGVGPEQVRAVVERFAVLGLMRPRNLDVDVQYTGRPGYHARVPGSQVTITARYPYDPWVLPQLRLNLASTSSGVIVY